MEFPTYVQIEPVGQCNLRCQMCPIQFRQDGRNGPPAFMPFAIFQSIIAQFPHLEHLHLQGLGEPMMHPRFFDMVRLAAARGVRVTTNTNLTLCSRRRAELCVTSGLDCVHVSIDGATAETYERIRVRARFQRVVNNLTLLRDVRERLGANRPLVRLVMVLMRQNLHELPDLVRAAREWGVDSVFVQHLCHDFGEASLPAIYEPMRQFVQSETLLGEDPARIEDYFSAARELADALGIELRLPRIAPQPHPPGTPGPQRCDWPWRGAYFSYDGYAMPCCMISTPDRFNFGRVTDADAATIWNSTPYETFREQLASDSPPEICQKCAVYSGIF